MSFRRRQNFSQNPFRRNAWSPRYVKRLNRCNQSLACGHYDPGFMEHSQILLAIVAAQRVFPMLAWITDPRIASIGGANATHDAWTRVNAGAEVVMTLSPNETAPGASHPRPLEENSPFRSRSKRRHGSSRVLRERPATCIWARGYHRRHKFARAPQTDM
jgi:hypothetical protein